jgi:AAA domain/SPOR domain
VPFGVEGPRSQNVQHVCARPVRLARRFAEDAADRLRRHVGRRSQEQPAERCVETRPQLSVIRIPSRARAVASFAVLVIDEAQNLPLSLLEEIRILSDLEGPEKLLQVVLVGQLEFLPKLKDPQMRQVDQRVSVRCQLGALDRAAVAGYIAHRLSVAGGGTDRVNFSEDAIDAIYRATNGNPRLINLVCDKSLHHGYLTRTFNIGPEIVGRALTELGVTQLTAAPDPIAEFRPEETVPEVTAPQAVAEPPTSVAQGFGAAIAAFSEEAHEEAPPQALLEQPAPPLTIGLERALKWITAGLAGLGVGVFVLMLLGWRNHEQAWAAAKPTSPQIPANTLLREVALPHLPVSATSGDATAASFEIGVAVFAKPTRAEFLEAELAAGGFKARTHLIELAGSPMFEVRIGPYATREAVEIDVTRVRQMPGYADARVIPATPAAR